MKHYGQSYWEILETPLKVFWLMNTNIDRISAETDKRNLDVYLASQGKEMYEAISSKLERQLEGVVIYKEEKLNESAIDELKRLQQQMKLEG